jgi:hypothetical protein
LEERTEGWLGVGLGHIGFKKCFDEVSAKGIFHRNFAIFNDVSYNILTSSPNSIATFVKKKCEFKRFKFKAVSC